MPVMVYGGGGLLYGGGASMSRWSGVLHVLSDV